MEWENCGWYDYFIEVCQGKRWAEREREGQETDSESMRIVVS